MGEIQQFENKAVAGQVVIFVQGPCPPRSGLCFGLEVEFYYRQVNEKKSWPRGVGEGGSSVDGERALQLARSFKISNSMFMASMETFCSTSTHVPKLTHSTTGHTLPELLGRSVLSTWH